MRAMDNEKSPDSEGMIGHYKPEDDEDEVKPADESATAGESGSAYVPKSKTILMRANRGHN